MTTIVQTQLVAPVLLAATDAAPIYTVPINTVVKIGRPVFSNPSAGAVLLTAGISTGGALGGLSLINARSLAAGETYVSPELAGAVLPPGSAIRAFGNVAIVCTISGITIQ